MTIRGHSENEHEPDEKIISLSAVWSFLFKIGLAMVPLGALFSVWLVKEINTHETRLTVLEFRANNMKAGNNTNSVSIGSKESAAADESHKDWISTEDVAAKEKVTARTVINWIEQKKIIPPPRKEGKAWVISANYRVMPNSSDDFRNFFTP